MSSNLESPQYSSNPDEQLKGDHIQDSKLQQSYNLRKVNIPPLKRDHSRSQDLTDKMGFIQNISASTASGLKNKQIPQIVEEYNSDDHSVKSKLENEDDKDDNEMQSPRSSRKSSQMEQDMSSNSKAQTPPSITQNQQLNTIDERMARRKQLRLRENLSPQQLQMNGDYVQGHQSELDHKTTGRWSRQEHEKFIVAMHMFGRDWKKVEMHIGTRSGAQIRSHAQKFFNRIEKELRSDVDQYIQQKAKALLEKQGNLGQPEQSQDLMSSTNKEQKLSGVGDFSTSGIGVGRDRSVSHTFGQSESNNNPFYNINESSNNNMIQKPQLPQQTKLEQNDSKKSKAFKSKNRYAFSPVQNQQESSATVPANPLQKVLQESFNNYQNPQDNSHEFKITLQQLENQFIEQENLKNHLLSELLLTFNDTLSQPEAIQKYIDDLKKIHSTVMEIYIDEMEKDARRIPFTLKQKVLAIKIELSNNIQLLHEIQEFVALSISLDFQIQNYQKPSFQQQVDSAIPNFQYNKAFASQGGVDSFTPQSGYQNNLLMNMLNQFTQNNLSRDLFSLLQGNQRVGSRKISTDWMDRSFSHENVNERSFSNINQIQDGTRKRENKAEDKQNEMLQKKLGQSTFNKNPHIAAIGAALGASGSFKPIDSSEITAQRIQRLRGQSISNDEQEKISPQRADIRQGSMQSNSSIEEQNRIALNQLASALGLSSQTANLIKRERSLTMPHDQQLQDQLM